MLREKAREGPDVLADARRLQRGHVAVARLHGDHRPRIAARGHHHVHQEAAGAAVPVEVGVDVDEDEVAQHHPHGRVRLLGQELEEGWHGVAYGVRAERDVA